MRHVNFPLPNCNFSASQSKRLFSPLCVGTHSTPLRLSSACLIDAGTRTACPPGTFSDSPSATSEQDCPPCPPGYYCPSGSTKLPCPPGHYCEKGVTEPVPCPKGTRGGKLLPVSWKLHSKLLAGEAACSFGGLPKGGSYSPGYMKSRGGPGSGTGPPAHYYSPLGPGLPPRLTADIESKRMRIFTCCNS